MKFLDLARLVLTNCLLWHAGNPCFLIVPYNQTTSQQTATRPNNLPTVCGKPNIAPKESSRIINGFEATPHSWPYIVSVGTIYFTHVCGGVLIDNQTVLTASHCLYFSESETRVSIGIHDLLNDIKPSTTYTVKKIIKHEKYDPFKYLNDIALIKLNTQVKLSSEVNFICLNRDINLEKNKFVVVAGWGRTENSYYSRYLLQVNVPINDDSTCNFPYYDSSTQICAGDIKNRKDSCSGDSGGPLMKNHNGLWNLIGIVSYGDGGCFGYGVYTKVNEYFDWILKNM